MTDNSNLNYLSSHQRQKKDNQLPKEFLKNNYIKKNYNYKIMKQLQTELPV